MTALVTSPEAQWVTRRQFTGNQRTARGFGPHRPTFRDLEPAIDLGLTMMYSLGNPITEERQRVGRLGLTRDRKLINLSDPTDDAPLWLVSRMTGAPYLTNAFHIQRNGVLFGVEDYEELRRLLKIALTGETDPDI